MLAGFGPPDDRAAPPSRIVYVAAYWRSGSTLLDLMLGQLDGFVSVGELRQVWQKGCVENRRCGCGRAFHDCPFWTAVGQRAFGGWDRVDLRELLRLRDRLDRASSVPLLSLPRAVNPWRGDVDRYVDVLRSMFGAIQDVAAARVIVDSSKSPAHALLLSRLPGFELDIVHLVRDSRGVGYSWMRGRKRRTELGQTVPSTKASPVRTSFAWLAYNGALPLIRRGAPRGTFLRYEDLAAAPAEGLRRVLDDLSVPAGTDVGSFVRDGRVALEPNHMVYGNRMRFASGELEVRVDDEWRRRMDPRARWLATAITYPLLRRYGYAARA
jgi:hypothetical protein